MRLWCAAACGMPTLAWARSTMIAPVGNRCHTRTEKRGEFGMVATHQVEALSRQIAREFDPDKIILFGSHAYGIPAEYSDVDLLVIMPFEGSGFDQSLEILDRVDPRFAIDLIVRRPDDTERRYREFDPLIRDALDRGRILYEQNG